MIFGDASCDNCQIAAASDANEDANDPNALINGGPGYQCSTFPVCSAASSTVQAEAGYTAGSSSTPTSSSGGSTSTGSSGSSSGSSSSSSSGGFWSTLTSALQIGQNITKGTTGTKTVASSSSILLPLLLVGGGGIAVIVLMNKKKKKS